MVSEDGVFAITVLQIRYCARFIARTLDNMWLACGTVFNEVLLWKVMDKQLGCDKVLVKKRLIGHYGVIFSVRYCQERQLLCSVSDDRSIKVWKVVFTNCYSDVTVSWLIFDSCNEACPCLWSCAACFYKRFERLCPLSMLNVIL